MIESIETLLARSPLPDGTIASPELVMQGRRYFGDIIRNERPAMEAHRKGGHLAEHRKGKGTTGRNYLGAIRHSVLQAARMQAGAPYIGLNPEYTGHGRTGAVAHDAGKLDEYKALVAAGFEPQAYLDAGSRFHDRLRADDRLSPESIIIASKVGHESIDAMEELVRKPLKEWTQLDRASAFMNLLDNQARHDQLAEGITYDDEGRPLNQLDRRMAQNSSNGDYTKINKWGKDHYGKLTYDQQAETGHKVENAVAGLVLLHAGVEINGFELPTVIDQWLIDDIRAVQL